MTHLLKAIEEKIKQLPYGYDSIKVFGSIRLNIHIKCVSRETAEKWAIDLASIGKVSIIPSFMDQSIEDEQKRVPARKGFLVHVVG